MFGRVGVEWILLASPTESDLVPTGKVSNSGFWGKREVARFLRLTLRFVLRGLSLRRGACVTDSFVYKVYELVIYLGLTVFRP